MPTDPEGGLADTEDQDEESKVTDQAGDTLQTEQDEDPVEVAFKARLESESERIRQEAEEKARTEFEARLETDRRRQTAEQEAEQLLNSFGSTVREMRDNLKRVTFWDADREEARQLSDAEIEELVVKPAVRYNLRGQQAEALRLRKELADAALSSLEEPDRKTFIERGTGKDFKDWLSELTEVRAPKTKWAQQFKKDQEAAIKAAEARGYARGQKAPAGTPPTGDGVSTKGRSNIDLSSRGGIARAVKEGLISQDDGLKAWNKLSS